MGVDKKMRVSDTGGRGEREKKREKERERDV